MSEKRKHKDEEDPEVKLEKKLKGQFYGKKFWGPYLSERQWCTVREETLGNCWDSVTYDSITPGSYRWGEDGIFGLSDEEQKLCIGLSLWNGKDNFFKERFFGLTGPQGNHGEDVKEVYFYLDNHPDHIYMKAVYLYPQREFPYKELIETNKERTPKDSEYEILDTGVFEYDYWVIQVEYVKPVNEVILCKYTITNSKNSTQTCTLDIAPQFWFRNYYDTSEGDAVPCIHKTGDGEILLNYDLGKFKVKFSDSQLGCKPEIKLEKDTTQSTVPGRCKATYKVKVTPGGHDIIQWELSPANKIESFNEYSIKDVKNKTDMFYSSLYHPKWSDEEKHIAKGAWVGLLWNKQFYHYDIEKWYNSGQAVEIKDKTIKGKPGNWDVFDRNVKWRNHFKAHDILSVPDKWEFPWFASWDTCFQKIPFCRLDPEFSKNQLLLLLNDRYMSPDGQIPGCEFNFDDNNPPIHAWASLKVFRMSGGTDFNFLTKCYNKLKINYDWWMRNKQCSDNYTFHGGFLGLDNISVIDRGHPPDGYTIKQADATAWMALFALNMVEIITEIIMKGNASNKNNLQQDMDKYMKEFLLISKQLNKDILDGGFWNPQMNFYNDVLIKESTKQYIPIEVKSLVGLLPLVVCCKIKNGDSEWKDLCKSTSKEFAHVIKCVDEDEYFVTCVPVERMGCLLNRMFDEEEFLSKFGIRSLSKAHMEPYTLELDVMAEAVEVNQDSTNVDISFPSQVTMTTDGNFSFNQKSEDISVQKEVTMATDVSLTDKPNQSISKGDKSVEKEVAMTTDVILTVKPNKLTSKGDKSVQKDVTMTTGCQSVTKENQSVQQKTSFTPVGEFSLHYTPGEADSGIMGGNSNWRGPIWMCANYILLDSLEKIHTGLDGTLSVNVSTADCPVSLNLAVKDVCKRLVSIFLPDMSGSRPVHGGKQQFTRDFWKDKILYYEYFHSDTGRGCGASHQTGWTSLIAEILYKMYK